MTVKLTVKTAIVGLAIFLVAFMVLGSVSIVGWQFSNSNWFCSNACHQVHPEEPIAQQLSAHANINCVDCHIGRLSFFPSLVRKTGHLKHVWYLIVGYERPTYSSSMAHVGNTCEGCHAENTHKYNLLGSKQRFAKDEKNTETRLTMTLRNVGRIFGGEDRRGMNWHSSGNVQFVATDVQKQNIEFVEATLPGGEVVTYKSVKATMSDDEIAAAERHTMACVDCHNRAGHPFRDPESVVDAAFASGELNSDLPYAKKYILDMFDNPVESKEAAREIVDQAYATYREAYPDAVIQDPEASESARQFIEERKEFLIDLMVSSDFLEAEDVTWRSFPDNQGHKNFPGCFRCHSGRLQDAKGTPIPVNCSTCHSLPLVTQRDRIPGYYLALLDQKKPRNHRKPDWMSNHMDYLGDQKCSSCHEEIKFGVNDKSFCSNSGCHAVDWQYLDLSALRND
ncbi:MAG: hypothetical protein JSW21_03905 [Gammaproteobacteria bacterium]|nr:MAG: hypothetical protein JSW21_03905 [Gammaproteobacteria bacterium]